MRLTIPSAFQAAATVAWRRAVHAAAHSSNVLPRPALPCPALLQLSEAATFFGLDEHQKDTLLGGWLMAAFCLIGAPAALMVCGDTGL